MIKYLDIADFHYNPNRKEECISAFSKIIKTDNKTIPNVLIYGLDEINKKSVMAHDPFVGVFLLKIY